MSRDMLSGSRAVLIGLVFFVLIVGGSLLYSWYVHRTADAELAETQRKVQPIENKNETHTTANTVDTNTVDFEQMETPLETDDSQVSDDTDVSAVDEASEGLDMADAFLPDDFVSGEEIAEDVPVSPFGYGPYPEVPADYPWKPIWTLSDEDRAHYSQAHPDGERGIELMQRVGIKLWQMGQNFTGIAYSNGRIYPNFPDTVYVDVQQTETGTSIAVTGSFISQEDMELIKNGDTPPGITVLDMSEGIEPMSFLGL